MDTKRTRWVIAAVALCVAASSVTSACGSGKSPTATAEPADEPSTERVEVSATVAKEAGITVTVATRAVLPVTVDLTGEVAADPDATAEVPVRVAGRLVAVHFKEGDRVVAGQVLATIESGEMARVKAELGSMQARAKAARLRATRLAALVEQGIESRQDLESAEADAVALESDVAGASQTLSGFGATGGGSARLTLRAPLGGYVMRRDAILGQAVDAEHTLAQITNLDHAYFLARLFEKDVAQIRTGAPVAVSLRAVPGATFQGTVETIGRQLDPVARAVVARIRIDNRDDLLKVGLFGTATVATAAASAPQIVVPTSAVTRVGERDLVFVEVEPGTFEPRTVRRGRASHVAVELLDGVAAGDRIATAGVFSLKSLLLKSSFGEDD